MIGFGRVIRKFRKDAGLTQRALARMVHVTPTYISRLENEASEPSIKLLKKIARAMKVPPEVVFWEAVDIPIGVTGSERRTYTLAKRVARRWLEASRRPSPPERAIQSGRPRYRQSRPS